MAVPRRGATLAALVALVAPLGACAGDAPNEARPLVDLTPTSPPPTTAPPTPEQIEATIIGDYRTDWTVVNAAYAESTVVGLHRVTAGPILYGISDEILHGIRYGLFFDGAMTHHPTVESIEGDVAFVVDCLLLEDEVRDRLTGEVVNSYEEWWDLRVQLLRQDGAWKLYDYEYRGDRCEPPDPTI